MNTRLNPTVRCAARWCAGLTVIPLSVLTAVFFCNTGRPVPQAFVPNIQPDYGLEQNSLYSGNCWSENHCQLDFTYSYVIGSDNSSVPLFNDTDLSRIVAITVFDYFTMQKLGFFHSSYIDVGQFAITPDRQRLLTLSNGTLRVRKLQGAIEANVEFRDHIAFEPPSTNDISFTFSADGQRALIYSHNNTQCVLYDLKTRKQEMFRWPKEQETDWFSAEAFIDSKGTPKILMSLSDEVWDVATRKLEWTLEPIIRKKTYPYERCLIKMAGIPILVTHHDDEVLTWHSLSDGKIFRTQRIPAAVEGRFQFSPDAKWLIGSNMTPVAFVETLRKWNKNMAEQLERWLPERERSVLLNLESNQTYCDHLGEARCDFTKDGTQMRSFTKDGY
ncbi:hypothetical protein BH10PLA2_BH10PLA2_31520 [soil metagenome]